MPVFKTRHDQHKEHNGKRYELVRTVPIEEHDILDVGPMFIVRVSTGETIQTFHDELHGHTCKMCNGHATYPEPGEEPDCWACWDTGHPISHEQEQALESTLDKEKRMREEAEE